RDPRIKLLKGQQAFAHEVWCEEFGQGGRDSQGPGFCPCKMDIGVYRKAHARQHMYFVQNLLLCEPCSPGQRQPRVNTPLPLVQTVVVADAMEPGTTYLADGTIGDDGRV